MKRKRLSGQNTDKQCVTWKTQGVQPCFQCLWQVVGAVESNVCNLRSSLEPSPCVVLTNHNSNWLLTVSTGVLHCTIIWGFSTAELSQTMPSRFAFQYRFTAPTTKQAAAMFCHCGQCTTSPHLPFKHTWAALARLCRTFFTVSVCSTLSPFVALNWISVVWSWVFLLRPCFLSILFYCFIVFAFSCFSNCVKSEMLWEPLVKLLLRKSPTFSGFAAFK